MKKQTKRGLYIVCFVLVAVFVAVATIGLFGKTNKVIYPDGQSVRYNMGYSPIQFMAEEDDFSIESTESTSVSVSKKYARFTEKDTSNAYGRKALFDIEKAEYPNGGPLVALYDDYYNLLNNFHSEGVATYQKLRKYYYIQNGISLSRIHSEYSADVSAKVAANVINTVLRDNPQFYWLSNVQQETNSDEIKVRVDAQYSNHSNITTGYNRTQMNEFIANGLAYYQSLVVDCTTEAEKAKIIHDELCNNIAYPTAEEYAYLTNPTTANYKAEMHSIAGVFTGITQNAAGKFQNFDGKKVVCEGYAEAFQYILNSLGIECIVVTGQGVNSADFTTENHEWNMAKLDGKWYNFDLTWDDGSYNQYGYFAVPQTAFFDATHIADKSDITADYLYPLPEASKEEHAIMADLYPEYQMGAEFNVYTVEEGSEVRYYSGAQMLNSDNAIETDALWNFKVVGPRAVEVTKIYTVGKTFTVPNLIYQQFAEEGVGRTEVVENGQTTYTAPIAFAVTDIGDIEIEVLQGKRFSSVDLSSALYLENIGKNAFANKGIISAILPRAIATGETEYKLNTFKTIGERAFFGCNLNNVIFPDSLVEIGENAFCGCNLTAINLSNTNISRIGDYAFASNLTTVITLPSSLQSFTALAFADCDELCNVSIAEGGYYYVEDGIVYKSLKDGKVQLTMCPSALQVESYTLADGVVLGDGAFYGVSALNEVTLSETLNEVPQYAFYNTNLSAVLVGSKVESVGTYAFNTVDELSLTFDGKAPKQCGASLVNDQSVIYMYSDNTESWLSGYDVNTCAWSGYTSYFIYREAPYVMQNADDLFDTDDKQGEMSYQDGVWTTKSLSNGRAVSVISDETLYRSGTMFVMSVEVTGVESGVMFCSDEQGASNYYKFAVDDLGNAVLWQSVDGELSQLMTMPLRNVELSKVELLVTMSDSVIRCYVNGKQYIYYDNATAVGEYFALCAEREGATFESLSIRTFGANTFEFKQAAGSVSVGKNNIVFNERSLAYNNNYEYDGTSKFEISANVHGEAGFVLGLNKAESVTAFFESAQADYYYAYIDGDIAKVRKVAKGIATDVATARLAEFDNAKTYNLKAVRENNVITLYVNNELVLTYEEGEEALQGVEYGLRGEIGATMTALTIKFKNDYSKLQFIDGYYVNRQNIRFLLDEENATATIGVGEGENTSAYNGANYGVVVIPESVRYGSRTYQVTAIGDNAFATEKLVLIKLPATITAIGENAFKGCANLEKAIYAGAAPMAAGANAFDGCSDDFVIEITLAQTTSWGISHDNPLWIAFGQSYICVVNAEEDNYYYTSALVSAEHNKNGQNLEFQFSEESAKLTDATLAYDDIVIPSVVAYKGAIYNVTAVGERAFFGNDGIKKVTIGANVATIEAGAFQSSSVTTIEGGANLNKIGENAFESCLSLVNFGEEDSCVLPEKLISIGANAFANCIGIKKLVIKNNLKAVAARAFYNCENLTEIKFGTNVELIEDGAFAECSALTTFNADEFNGVNEGNALPSSIKKIYARAFENCISLQKITLPTSLIIMRAGSFAGCTALEEVIIKSYSLTTISEGVFENCTSLVNVVLPLDMQTIEERAFFGCTALEVINLPDSINVIDGQAFMGCTSLSFANFKGDRPQIGMNAFGEENDKLTLTYDIVKSGWTYPYTVTEDNYYYTTFRNDTYTGKDGVIVKYLSTQQSEWFNINGGNRYRGNTPSVALVTNIIPAEDALTVLQADITAETAPQQPYGLLFGIDLKGGESFNGEKCSAYRFAISADRIARLTYIDNGVETVVGQNAINELALPLYEATKTYTLKVLYNPDTENGIAQIKCYVNGVLFVNVNDAPLASGSICGLSADTANTRFENTSITVIGDILTFDSQQGGGVSDMGDTLNLAAGSLVLVADTDYEYNGTSRFEFTSRLKVATSATDRDGIVFGFSKSAYLSEDGKTMLKYKYFLATTRKDGERVYLDLYKVTTNLNAETNEIVSSEVQPLVDSFTLYNEDAEEMVMVKVLWNGKMEIECYANDEWAFRYYYKGGVDSDPVDGTGYGLYSANGAEFAHTIVTLNGNTSAGMITEESFINPQTEGENYVNSDGMIFRLDDQTMTACVIKAESNTTISFARIPGVVVITDSDGVQTLYKVTEIEASAFEGNNNITVVEISDNISKIGEGAFANCTSLTDVSVPTTLTAIADRLFDGCIALENFYLPESVESIGEYAYRNCGFEVANFTRYIKSIAYNAFDGCVNLRAFSVEAAKSEEDDVSYSSKSGVMYNGDGTVLVLYPLGRLAATFSIPEGVTAIGKYAFANNAKLSRVELPATLNEIGENAFYNTSVANVVFGSGLLTIGNRAFENSKLVSVDLSVAQMQSIGEEAFANCTMLSSCKLPSSVVIGNGAFKNTSLTKLVLDAQSVGQYAFAEIANLRSVEIGMNVQSIDATAFSGCTLESYTVERNNTVYAAVDGVLFNKEMTVLLAVPALLDIEYYAIPQTVTQIADNAILASRITNIYVREGVEIGAGNFVGYNGLVIVHDDAYFVENELTNYVVYEQLTVEGISIYNDITKKEYTLGTEIDLSELVMAINYTYEGGNCVILADSFEATLPEAAGKQQVVISVTVDGTEHQTAFDVWMNEQSNEEGLLGTAIELQATPVKITKMPNQEFNPQEELTFVLVYDVADEDGNVKKVIVDASQLSFDMGGLDLTASGKYFITVTYQSQHDGESYSTLTCYVLVEVLDKSVSSVLFNAPTKHAYTYGEKLNVSGVSAILRYNTGDSKALAYGSDYRIMEYLNGEYVEFDSTLMNGTIVTTRVMKVVFDEALAIPQEIIDQINSRMPKFSVSRIQIVTPKAPELTATRNTITATVESDNEYFIYEFGIATEADGKYDWKSDGKFSGEFSGLKPGKTYYVKARIFKSDTTMNIIVFGNDSSLYTSESSSITTLKEVNTETPGIPVLTVKTNDDIRIGVRVTANPIDDPKNVTDMEYSYAKVVDGVVGSWSKWISIDKLAMLEGKATYKVVLRYKATDAFDESDTSIEATITTPRCTPNKPTINTGELTITDTTIDLNRDSTAYAFRIGSTTEECENAEWIVLDEEHQTPNLFEGLNSNTKYYIQIKVIETEQMNESEASDIVEVRTLRSAPKEVEFTVTESTLTLPTEVDGYNMTYKITVGGITIDSLGGVIDFTKYNKLITDGEEYEEKDEEGNVIFSTVIKKPWLVYGITFSVEARYAGLTTEDEELAVGMPQFFNGSTTKKQTEAFTPQITKEVDSLTTYITVLFNEDKVPTDYGMKAEFSIDGGSTWVDGKWTKHNGYTKWSYKFTGLTEDTNYNIVGRYKANEYYIEDENYDEYKTTVKTKISLEEYYKKHPDARPVIVGEVAYGNTITADLKGLDFAYTWYLEKDLPNNEINVKDFTCNDFTIDWEKIYDVKSRTLNFGKVYLVVYASTDDVYGLYATYVEIKKGEITEDDVNVETYESKYNFDNNGKEQPFVDVLIDIDLPNMGKEANKYWDNIERRGQIVFSKSKTGKLSDGLEDEKDEAFATFNLDIYVHCAELKTTVKAVRQWHYATKQYRYVARFYNVQVGQPYAFNVTVEQQDLYEIACEKTVVSNNVETQKKPPINRTFIEYDIVRLDENPLQFGQEVSFSVENVRKCYVYYNDDGIAQYEYEQLNAEQYNVTYVIDLYKVATREYTIKHKSGYTEIQKEKVGEYIGLSKSNCAIIDAVVKYSGFKEEGKQAFNYEAKDSNGKKIIENNKFVWESSEVDYKEDCSGYRLEVQATIKMADGNDTATGYNWYYSDLISKSKQETPNAPAVDEEAITETTISVTPVQTAEYSINNRVWSKNCCYTVDNSIIWLDVDGLKISLDGGITFAALDNTLQAGHITIDGNPAIVEMTEKGVKYSIDGTTWLWLSETKNKEMVFIYGEESTTVKQLYKGVEYRLVNDKGVATSWQRSPDFIGLNNATKYRVQVRYLGISETYLWCYGESEASAMTEVSTLKLTLNEQEVYEFIKGKVKLSSTQTEASVKLNAKEITADSKFFETEGFTTDYIQVPSALLVKYRVEGSALWSDDYLFSGFGVSTKQNPVTVTIEYIVVGTTQTNELRGSLTLTMLKKPALITPDMPEISVDDNGDDMIYATEVVVHSWTEEKPEYRVKGLFEFGGAVKTKTYESECINGLLPNQTYSISARYKANDEYEASAWSEALVVTTLRLEQEAPVIEKDAYEFVSAIDRDHPYTANYKLTVEDDFDGLLEVKLIAENYDSGWLTGGKAFSKLARHTEYELYVRYAQTETHYASGETLVGKIVTAKGSQIAPKGLPEAELITANSVKLIEAEGYEYYAMLNGNTVSETAYIVSFDETLWQKSGTFAGLEKDRTYTFFMRLAETEDLYASDPCNIANDHGSKVSTGIAYTTTPTSLTGTITIYSSLSGKYCFGVKLSIGTENTNKPNYSKFKYSWYTEIDGQPVEFAKGKDLVINPNHIGMVIWAKVEGDATCSGELTSDRITITKGYLAIPKAPIVKVDGTTITVTAEKGYTYSIDGGKTWETPQDGQTSLIFTNKDDNIQPNTTYNICCKAIGNELYFDSEISDISKVTTTKDQAQKPHIAVAKCGADYLLIEVELGCNYALDFTNITIYDFVKATEENTELYKGVRVMRFANLEPDKKYTAKAYRDETELYFDAEANIGLTTIKYEAEAPNAPVAIEITASKIVLDNPNGLLQFALVSGETIGKFTDSAEFNGLDCATEYTFVCRTKENSTTYASAASEYYTVKTDKGRLNAPNKADLASTDTTITIRDRVNSYGYYLVVGNYDIAFDKLPEEVRQGAVNYTDEQPLENLEPTRKGVVSYYTVYVYIPESEKYYQSPTSIPVAVAMKEQFIVTLSITDEEQVVTERTLTFMYGENVVESEKIFNSYETNVYRYEVTLWQTVDGSTLPTAITQDMAFTATYERSFIEYMVTFKVDEDVFAQKTYHYGDEIELPEEPTKGATQNYEYKFICWLLNDEEVTEFVANANYEFVAKFEHLTRYYTVEFLNYDNTVFHSIQVTFGETVTAPEENPTQPKSIEMCLNYNFAEWRIYNDKAEFPFKVVKDGIKFIPYFESFGEHTPSDSNIDIPATCTKDGLRKIICKGCNKVITEEVLKRLGHDFAEDYTIDLEPGCETKGSKSRHCSRCEVVTDETEIDATGHTPSDWIEEKAATCTESGTQYKECTACKKVLEEANVEALGHDFAKDYTTDTEPGCETKGSKSRHCSRCDEVTDITEIEAKGHNYSEWEVVKEATCTTDGQSKHTCTVCDKVENRVDKALGHDFAKDYTTDVEPGCETKGSKSRHCSRCDEVTDITEIEAKGHNYSEWEVVKEATCTTDGQSKHTCTVCDKVENRVDKALGHDFAKDYTTDVEPGCETKGSKSRHCSRCDEVTDETEIDATGHTYGEWKVVKEATCTTDGQNNHTCTACGMGETCVIKALGHDYAEDYTTDTEPGCETKGSKSRHCSRCDEVTDITEIEAKGHNYSEWEVVDSATCTTGGQSKHTCTVCDKVENRVDKALGHKESAWIEEKAATCTENGSKYIKCDVCGERLKTEVINATGHTYGEWEVVKEATCTTGGQSKHTCTVCDKVETRVDEALGHKESAWIEEKAATCTENGSKYIKCDVCGERLKTEVINATGHTYGEWEVVKEATCTTDGQNNHTCTACGMGETCVIKALGHKESAWIEEKAATCTENGSKYIKCDVCGERLKTEVINATGHTYGEWEVVKEATCTTDGQNNHTCTVCDKVETRVDEALGHDFAKDYTTDVEPGCETKGSKSRHCSRCDEVTDITEIEAKGHNYSEWEVVKEATAEEDGQRQRTCSVCGHKESETIAKLGLVILFTEKVEKLTEAATMEQKFAAINEAITAYQSLSAEERAAVENEYRTLNDVIVGYNTTVTEENDIANNAVKVLFAATTVFMALAAAMFVLKRRLF